MGANQVTYIDLNVASASMFWTTIVIPNVETFKLEPSSARHGLNAAWSLWHLHEWIWHDCNQGQQIGSPAGRAFRSLICQECPELAWLRDLSDATKHRGLQRRSVKVSSIGPAIGKGGAGGWDIPTGGWNVGTFAYGAGQPELRFVLRDGTVQWLANAVNAVEAYWTAYLTRNGLYAPR